MVSLAEIGGSLSAQLHARPSPVTSALEPFGIEGIFKEYFIKELDESLACSELKTGFNGTLPVPRTRTISELARVNRY